MFPATVLVMNNSSTLNPPVSHRKDPTHRGGSPQRSRKKSKLPYYILSGLLLIAAGGGWFAWQRHAQQVAASAATATSTIAATRGDVEKTVESSGTVAANLEVEIKCRASGEITKLPFDISQTVKKGDLLCQLDPTDEQLSVRSAEVKLAQAKSKLAQAQTTLEQATQNLVTTRTKAESSLASAKVKAANARQKADRQKELISQQLGSQEEYETAETDAATALADQHTAEVAVAELKQQEIALETKRQDVLLAEEDVRAAQIDLDQAKKQLDYTTVLAPMDGTVSDLDVQIGTIVASGINNVSGGTTILTLSDLSRIFVNASVDEADIGGVRVGQKARVTVDSYPGQTFTGTIVRIAVKGVTESNVVTFEVKVEVTDEHKTLLKPQMTANVSIIESEASNVVTLPTTTIQRREGKPFVKLGSGEERSVQLGVQGNERVEILTGITEGEHVINNNSEQKSRWRNEKQSNSPPPPPG